MKMTHIVSCLGLLAATLTFGLHAQQPAATRQILLENKLRPEASAPPEITSKLASLRANIREQKATFTVGYTPALSIPLSSLAGLKIPADITDATIQQVNARAVELENVDRMSAQNAHFVPLAIACKATSASFDWRKLNAHMPPVRGQCCGDCWDHAANEAFDDSYGLRNGATIETSVQYAELLQRRYLRWWLVHARL